MEKLLDLAVEMYFEIFKFLSIEMVFKLGKSFGKFRKMCSYDPLWKQLLLNEFDEKTIKEVSKIVSRYSANKKDDGSCVWKEFVVRCAKREKIRLMYHLDHVDGGKNTLGSLGKRIRWIEKKMVFGKSGGVKMGVLKEEFFSKSSQVIGEKDPLHLVLNNVGMMEMCHKYVSWDDSRKKKRYNVCFCHYYVYEDEKNYSLRLHLLCGGKLDVLNLLFDVDSIFVLFQDCLEFFGAQCKGFISLGNKKKKQRILNLPFREWTTGDILVWSNEMKFDSFLHNALKTNISSMNGSQIAAMKGRQIINTFGLNENISSFVQLFQALDFSMEKFNKTNQCIRSKIEKMSGFERSDFIELCPYLSAAPLILRKFFYDSMFLGQDFLNIEVCLTELRDDRNLKVLPVFLVNNDVDRVLSKMRIVLRINKILLDWTATGLIVPQFLGNSILVSPIWEHSIERKETMRKEYIRISEVIALYNRSYVYCEKVKKRKKNERNSFDFVSDILRKLKIPFEKPWKKETCYQTVFQQLQKDGYLNKVIFTPSTFDSKPKTKDGSKNRKLDKGIVFSSHLELDEYAKKYGLEGNDHSVLQCFDRLFWVRYLSFLQENKMSNDVTEMVKMEQSMSEGEKKLFLQVKGIQGIRKGKSIERCPFGHPHFSVEYPF